MMVREGIPTVISDLDKHALEAALALRDKNQGKVSVFTMAPESAKENLLQALAMGADEAFLLSDRAFAGADTLATSCTLAAAIREKGPFDIVITGNESDDGSTGQVSAQLGEWLGLPHVMNVSALSYSENFLEVTVLSEDGTIDYKVTLPAVLGVTRKVNKPRLANIMGMLKAKSKPLTVLHYGDFTVDENFIGLKGSPTQPGDIYSPQMSRKTEELSGSPEEIADRIIQELIKAGVRH
ncbi:Caffeyl-CoA reductase-Etf complex subunit CarD [bioreactor metagenome]|uniref:Caffeyl-CoA reductase-Etf complex subunit CarD n=1 Tax=bioreactor metagenome TaxID=1076179 RepID=A0A644YLI9_9ZZZZ